MRTPSPGPEQQREEKGSFSIQQSLQDMWRELSVFFRRPSQELTGETQLEALWRDISNTRAEIDSLIAQSHVTGDLKPAAEALRGLQLKTTKYDKLLEEMQAPMRTLLGRNFLGVDEWRRGLGVRVGVPPNIPEYITPELLHSESPLHPGQMIKDTHSLLLMPKTVDGRPYSALKLSEVCEKRDNNPTIELFRFEQWKECSWAPQQATKSEWILIPKSDPDPNKVASEQHFRRKSSQEQKDVVTLYAQDYEEASALQVMTQLILNFLVNGEYLLERSYLCTRESPSAGTRVLLGLFGTGGLSIIEEDKDYPDPIVGRALVRRSRS
jgi:hypothetical protein